LWRVRKILLLFLTIQQVSCKRETDATYHNNSSDTIVVTDYSNKEWLLLPGASNKTSLKGTKKSLHNACCPCEFSAITLRVKNGTRKLLKDPTEQKNWSVDSKDYRQQKIYHCIFSVSEGDIY
jgi:hypothetical protein